MFFDDLENLPAIAEKVGFSIFIIPKNAIDALQTTGKKRIKTAAAPFAFPNTTYYLEPDEKHKVKVDQIRDLEAEMTNKQLTSRFFVIKHAELLNDSAENAALKLLEEPKEHCHLVFLATNISAFLPTVLSRASIYVYRTKNPLETPPAVDQKVLDEAKLLLAASPSKTFDLVNRWTDKKHKLDRPDVLEILGATIEIAYKSYFRTSNRAFLRKVPSLLKAYENIEGNGHIKLQLTAHLC
ncbi:hypothetical protein IJ090_00140 [Candidatus Saccharibacteria bacterium]|nr:hypothetical protein [Candidatus Saccharibacteria bacterium]